MLSHRRSLILEFAIFFLALLFFFLPAQAGSLHKTKVIEHWTPDRIQTAQPRDFFLDKHGKAYMGSRKAGFSPYGLAVNNPTSLADTTGPSFSNRSPVDNATVGSAHVFSADVTDSESGVRSVNFIIQYPNGNTESFRGNQTSATNWSISLSGFSDSPSWAWWIEAKDRAKKGGNRSTSSVYHFSVNSGEPPTEPPTEPPSEGVIENAQWTQAGAVQTATGRIFFEMPNNSKRKGPWSGYVCSGTVINDSDTPTSSNARAIIITAAHCAYDDVNKAFARNVLFIPNQAATTGSATDTNCSNDPMGCWAPHFAVVDDDWSSRTFPNNIPWDYAYYVVDDNDATAHAGPGTAGLQAAAGGLPVSFIPPYVNDGEAGPTTLDYTHALGYSYSDDPNFMYCAEDMSTVDFNPGETKNWWLAHCGLSGGSSGGPWLQPINSGGGPIISVNSWGYTTEPGMAGPFLDFSSASCLLDLAENTDFNSIDTREGSEGIEGPCE